MNTYTDTTNVDFLFSRDVQYQVPFYQRRYIWNETNWDALWNDIRSQTDLKLRDEDSRHFMGTIVTSPIENGQLPRSEVIDGQQRLVTFQIILCAIRDICQSAGHTEVRYRIDRYIWNSQIAVARDTPDSRYKFLPTSSDKEAFCAIIDSNPIKNTNHLMLQAYDYFKAQIAAYVVGDSKRVIALLSSVVYDFVIVKLSVDSSDANGKIFASINARGQGLSEFDLLRNNIFLRTGTNIERLYHRYWVHFEKDAFWTTEILERFLRDFLASKLGIAIETGDLFRIYEQQYRSTLEADQDIEHELAELKQYAEIYREKIECND